MLDQDTAAKLVDASRTAALECAVAALGAARSHRMGLPAVMCPGEAEALWRVSVSLLRDIGVWPFPAMLKGDAPAAA